ncbi:MAG: MFS transporter [Sciscionella sp.]
MTVTPKTTPPSTPEMLLGRIARIRTWPFSYRVIWIVAVGYLFTFFDIFNINVSFVQTCVALQPGCTPANAFGAIREPLLWNLIGYVVGAIALSPLADRSGRRNLLMITMAITGLGSLYTALAPDMLNFTASRFITGIGTGADLAIINAYINEVAPANGRGRFSSWTMVSANLGAMIGIWLGLLLTTKPGHWPDGLPFALAGDGFSDGWRWMYGIGAILAVVSILMRLELPESPRWLIHRGRLKDAERAVNAMERRAAARNDLDAAIPVIAPTSTEAVRGLDAYRRILTSKRYRRRALVLLAMWSIAYVTVYTLAGGLTSLLSSLGMPHSRAGVVAAVGSVGLLLARAAIPLADRINRRAWLPASVLIMVVGALVLSTAGSHNMPLTVLGAVLLFLGNSLWVPITYAWSAELFPTRLRTSGFGLVDGAGHIGGGLGILLIGPTITSLGSLTGLLVVIGFLAVAALIAQLNPATHGRDLEEISP